MDNPIFAEWLRKEMAAKGMIQADLARASGLSRQAISKYYNGDVSNPDPEALKSLAKGLEIPPETIFRKAGLLPDAKSGKDLALEILGYKANELSEDQLEELIRYVEFIQDRDDSKTEKKTFLGRHTREGEAPPGSVN